MLQKSNYYLTRKKDRWQIIYITNARPVLVVPPVSKWHSKDKSSFSCQTASKDFSRMNLRFGCCRFCCVLRLQNGKLHYIHSQCLFLPCLFVLYTPPQADCPPSSGQIYTGTKVKRPPRTGFIKCLQFSLTLLDWLIKTYGCWDQQKSLKKCYLDWFGVHLFDWWIHHIKGRWHWMDIHLSSGASSHCHLLLFQDERAYKHTVKKFKLSRKMSYDS